MGVDLVACDVLVVSADAGPVCCTWAVEQLPEHQADDVRRAWRRLVRLGGLRRIRHGVYRVTDYGRAVVDAWPNEPDMERPAPPSHRRKAARRDTAQLAQAIVDTMGPMTVEEVAAELRRGIIRTRRVLRSLELQGRLEAERRSGVKVYRAVPQGDQQGDDSEVCGA